MRGKQIKIVRTDRGGEYYERYNEDGHAPCNAPSPVFDKQGGITRG